MSLIEVLCGYRDLILRYGREVADRWLGDACEEHIVEHIQTSVDSQGNFIDAEGYRFNP